MDRWFHNIKNRKTGSTRVLSCLFAFVLIVLSLKYPMEAKAEENVIKVGYIEQGNFIENNHGNYSGYGVEYLEKITEITGWEYEYYLDTWENCLQ